MSLLLCDQDIRRLREEGVHPAYQDETWLDYNHQAKFRKQWVDIDGR